MLFRSLSDDEAVSEIEQILDKTARKNEKTASGAPAEDDGAEKAA